MLATLAVPMTYAQAAAGLRRLRSPRFDDVLGSLGGVRSMVECLRILRELDPRVWGDAVIDGAKLLSTEIQDGMAQAAIEAVSRVAPLDTDSMELNGVTTALWPATMGYQMSWDDWGVTLEDLDSWGDQNAVWFFCQCLNQGDEEAFQKCAEHWDWEIGYPRKAFSPDYRLDTEKMFMRLRKEKLDCFIDAWQVAFYNTGTLYFDFNPYDEGSMEIYSLPLLTLNGVRQLRADYEKALPIQARFREAQWLFNARAEMPGELLAIFNKSLVKIGKPKTQVIRAQTLAEIWGLAEQANITRDNTATEADDEEENQFTDPYDVLEGHRTQMRVRTDGRIDEAHLTDILTDGGPELEDTLRELHRINLQINQTTQQLERDLGALGLNNRQYAPVCNDDDHGGQAIDPFYGPIRPDPEEDDEW